MYRPLHIDRKWVHLDVSTIPESFRQGLPYSDLVLQTLVRRGFSSVENAILFLDHTRYVPSSPYDLPGMESGIDRIQKAIASNEKIGVWGDFDVDGQTSTAILVSALRLAGADVSFHIPVRAKESHGITLPALQKFLSNGVNVVLTCDTGITNNEPIAYAQSQGIDVIVTDHHLPSAELPNAFALINPRFLPTEHPMATLPGAGTAYKFAEALLTNFNLDQNIPFLHDLAALGIIADLVELRGDTRYLVQSGLDRLRFSPRPALLAMLQAAEVDKTHLSEEQISFSIAPRLNAIGRLSDANPIVNFLLSEDPQEIAVTVNQLEGLNAKRKLLCDRVFSGALSMIGQDPRLLDQPVLILRHTEWPAGVVGIVASRLVELYHRPVILLVGQPGQPLRGSARSIEGIDITAAIRSNAPLLLSFGGHPMAAGLSLAEQNFIAFQRGICERVTKIASYGQVETELVIDQELHPVDVSLELAQSLEVLAPFGPGNPALIFSAPEMELTASRPVGKLGEHLLVDVIDPAGNQNRLIWWNGSGMPLPEGKFDLAYTVHPSNYRGEDQVSLEWLDYQMRTEIVATQIGKEIARVVNFDYRYSVSLLRDLRDLQVKNQLQVWKEGHDDYEIKGLDRNNLHVHDKLVIWSVPPSLETLRVILLKTKPGEIYWFLVSPAEHLIPFFLKHLGSLVKRELQQGVQPFSPATLAANCAVNEETIILGLEWLSAKGNIHIVSNENQSYILALGGSPDPGAQNRIELALTKSFQEIQAFTRFLRNSALDKLTEDLR